VAEQRRHERYPIDVEVEITEPAIGRVVVVTRDMSDGGVFLRVAPGQGRPALGSEITLRVTQTLGGEEPPLVRGRVVRATDDGIGVAFLDPGP
jgi:hypothetical protein